MGFLDVFVPTSESLGGGFAQYAAARERAAKQQQALEGYKQGLAAMTQGNQALAPFEKAVQAGAPADAIFGAIAPEYLKTATTQADAASRRTALLGMLNAEIAGGNKDPALPYIVKIASDPNAKPEVIDRFFERLIPKEQDPTTELTKSINAALGLQKLTEGPKPDDAFLKWARDRGYTVTDDNRNALYAAFEQDQIRMAGGKAGATAAAGTTGRATAMEAFEAPKVLKAANDWEQAAQGLFSANPGLFRTGINVANLYSGYYSGDPAAIAFFGARGDLINYAQEMRGSMRLSNTEFNGLMQALNSPFQTTASIHQLANQMRSWANRPEGFAAGGASASAGRVPIGRTPDGKIIYRKPDGSMVTD